MEKITCSKNNGKELQFNCAQYREAGGPERGNYAMTREEAERYISTLSDREIILLDALISSISQKRQQAQNPLVTSGKAEL